VLTQYKAQTLIGHIASGWNFLPRQLGEFVEVWPAQQRVHSGWYGGTADAVGQNLDLILAQDTKYTLVLASDHIYKMDFRPLLEQHAPSRANVTIACLPIPVERASAFGVLGVDPAGAVRSFREKPARSMLNAPDGTVLASMGIYVFDTDYLALQLERDACSTDSTHDFGLDILPVAVPEVRLGAFVFVPATGAT
jgi:glucose-1-phosphate adenylyltransferase